MKPLILKEPLFHFIVAGISLFLFFHFFRSEEKIPEKIIQISDEQIELMHSHWTQQLGRTPDSKELNGLIDDFIKEEILMREALAIGLDRDDIIIRRRLAQKMEFISNDMLTVAKPTSEEIEAYYKENLESFKSEGNISFHQIYFKPDKSNPAETYSKASTLKDRFNELQISETEISQYGDRTMLSPTFFDLPIDKIREELGDSEIQEKAKFISLKQWEGPFTSGFGLHLIYIFKRTPRQITPLQEVNQIIQKRIITERKEKLRTQFMANLRSKYKIKINEAYYPNYNYDLN